jgi:uncharacterized lipoprotein YmbA
MSRGNPSMNPYLRWSASFAAAAVLAGCAGSPPASYYTLLPAADTAAPVDGTPVAGTPVAGTPVAGGSAADTPAFALEIMPVSVPLQVDQPQIMLRTADDALSPMYSQRWASPLGEELQTALSHAMTAALGAPDVSALGASTGVPVWRVQVDVQRFDMLLGGPALLDATWRIRQSGMSRGKAVPPAVLLCRSLVRVPAPGADLPGLVLAQQRAVTALARTISSAILQDARVPPSSDLVQVRGCSRTAEAA